MNNKDPPENVFPGGFGLCEHAHERAGPPVSRGEAACLMGAAGRGQRDVSQIDYFLTFSFWLNVTARLRSAPPVAFCSA
jgi:hypothetical protein